MDYPMENDHKTHSVRSLTVVTDIAMGDHRIRVRTAHDDMIQQGHTDTVEDLLDGQCGMYIFRRRTFCAAWVVMRQYDAMRVE